MPKVHGKCTAKTPEPKASQRPAATDGKRGEAWSLNSSRAEMHRNFRSLPVAALHPAVCIAPLKTSGDRGTKRNGTERAREGEGRGRRGRRHEGGKWAGRENKERETDRHAMLGLHRGAAWGFNSRSLQRCLDLICTRESTRKYKARQRTHPHVVLFAAWLLLPAKHVHNMPSWHRKSRCRRFAKTCLQSSRQFANLRCT